MSNYKPKMYARALVDALSSKKDDKRVVANFITLLEKNQDIKKTDEIIVLTQKLLLKKTGNKKVVLQMARPNNVKNVLKNFVKKGDIVEEKINPALIAGVTITIDDEKQFDNSLATKLNNL